mgnify:CR=1 FL=1
MITTGRPLATQLPLFEGQRARVVDKPIPSVIACQTNGELIFTLAAFRWFEGKVLDCTYGRGQWWTRYRPADLTAHDLHTLDGVDFRQLPHDDGTFDTVCIDPPHIPAHGPPSAKAIEFAHRFGLDAGMTAVELNAMNRAGVIEAVRVAKPGGLILAKCCDYTDGSTYRFGLGVITSALEEAGAQLYDVIIHASGPGPGSAQSDTQRRTRVTHSYLVVGRRPQRRRQTRTRGGG